MKKELLIKSLNFFKNLQVHEEDVTSESERKNGQYVVIVTYSYKGISYKTQKLFYKNIEVQSGVKKPLQVKNYFNTPTYWLDHKIHDWPKGAGEIEIDNLIIKDMINSGDSDFEMFLKQIANNKNNGLLQVLTMDGRRKQYGFNLENNNHWHDLINLIKALLDSSDERIDKNWYNRLVFEWQSGERTSLSPGLGNRAIIHHLIENIKLYKQLTTMIPIVKLLKSRRQIILQGAPGTGKTYSTAEIALRIIGRDDVDYSDRKKLMEAYQEALEEGQIVFTTFHQSLDYEEFIEGIKPIPEGEGISYAVRPGIFKKICTKALQDEETNNLEDAIEDFKEKCSETEEGIVLKTKEGVSFNVWYRGGITFRVRSSRSAADEGKDFPASIENIIKLHKGIKRGMYNKSYVWGILNYLKKEYDIKDHKENELVKLEEEGPNNRNYVLIIDEINRGNISKIFGELISLLEADKRLGADNEIKCRLPYTPDEEFGVPENLYIIGTMNTTDRSLGHIDYAVRRRFGFVTLESDVNKIDSFYFPDNDLKTKAISLFKNVKLLIDDNTSPEFLTKDIMVGHSYFMAKDQDELNLKLEYEIKPLLAEYVKDGLLTLKLEDIESKINTLSV